MLENKINYQKVIGDLLQTYRVVFGPDVVLSVAGGVQGLQVSPSGEVLSLNGDPRLIFSELTEEYKRLSPEVFQIVFGKLQNKYQIEIV